MDIGASQRPSYECLDNVTRDTGSLGSKDPNPRNQIIITNITPDEAHITARRYEMINIFFDGDVPFHGIIQRGGAYGADQPPLGE